MQTIFTFFQEVMQMLIAFLHTYRLPLLCALGGFGVGVYTYGTRKLAELCTRQREEMRLHPDDPAPALPEKARQSALAFEIAGFIILMVACLGLLFSGYFDKYLALIGIGR